MLIRIKNTFHFCFSQSMEELFLNSGKNVIPLVNKVGIDLSTFEYGNDFEEATSAEAAAAWMQLPAE